LRPRRQVTAKGIADRRSCLAATDRRAEFRWLALVLDAHRVENSLSVILDRGGSRVLGDGLLLSFSFATVAISVLLPKCLGLVSEFCRPCLALLVVLVHVVSQQVAHAVVIGVSSRIPRSKRNRTNR
jgi:hypothetical protein